MTQLGGRTTIRRLRHKQVHDRAALDSILDAALVGHVGIVDDDGQPIVLPMAIARDGDRLLLHGSTASRVMNRLCAGERTCVTATALDGVTLARSVFGSTMQYRSAAVFGRASAVSSPEAKLDALRRLTEALTPGRWEEARHPSRAELAAVSVAALPLDEWSVKVSRAIPEDSADDLRLPIWAGVVPLVHMFGAPVPSDDLAPHIAVPGYVSGWANGRT